MYRHLTSEIKDGHFSHLVREMDYCLERIVVGVMDRSIRWPYMITALFPVPAIYHYNYSRIWPIIPLILLTR